MPSEKWGGAVSPSDRRDQLKLVYDYIKFHIALYLSTPAALAVVADGFDVKKSGFFVVMLVAAILVYLIAGIHAALFMGRLVNDPWQDEYLSVFEAAAFSRRRRIMHHSLYWLGLALGLIGLALAVLQKYGLLAGAA